jgi:hypothetical protein
MSEIDLTNYGRRLRDSLLRCKLASINSLEGCSEPEIEMVRFRQKVDFLPKVYREFLAEMGRNAGELFLGSSYTFNRVLTLKDDSNAELERFGHDFRIPEDAVVFLDHGGYAYWYFCTQNRDDNPEVYLYIEENRSVKKMADHLSEFFEDGIRELAPNCL